LSNFRFLPEEVASISNLMGWEAGKTKRSGYRCHPLTASCVVLRRLAYPVQWVDVETTFGMHASALSEVFWMVLEVFIATKGHLITNFRSDLVQERAVQNAEAIANKGAPRQNCVGFVDCTKIRMCRPKGSTRQGACYSGHKRVHCLTYQTVTAPDGLIVHFLDPRWVEDMT